MHQQAWHFRRVGERIPGNAEVLYRLPAHSCEHKFVSPFPFYHAQHKLIAFVRECNRAAFTVLCFTWVEPDAPTEQVHLLTPHTEHYGPSKPIRVPERKHRTQPRLTNGFLGQC